MSTHRKQTYQVKLAASGGERIEEIDHRSPQLAARAALQMHLTAIVLSVTCVWKVIGECGKCGGVILDDEKPKKRGEKLFCESCK